jgi:hypothetical protein
MNMQVLLGVWVAILAAYATVAVMRWSIGKREDDHMHFMEAEQALVATQTATAHKLDVLDRWKTALIVLLILWTVFIGGVQVWNVWRTSTTQPMFS